MSHAQFHPQWCPQQMGSVMWFWLRFWLPSLHWLMYSWPRWPFRSIIFPHCSYFKFPIVRNTTQKQDKIQAYITSFWHLLLTCLEMIIYQAGCLCGVHIRSQRVSPHIFIGFIYVHGRLLSEEGINGEKHMALVLNFVDEGKINRNKWVGAQ